MVELNSITSLSYSLIVIISPILILLFIYFLSRLFRKGTTLEILIGRITLGFLIFYTFYILIPATINVINPPENQYLTTITYVDLDSAGTMTSNYWNADFNSFIRFWSQLLGNALVSFLYYPLYLLPIIFIFGGVIAFFLVLYELRKKDPEQSLAKSISTIQFGYDDNPLDQIAYRLKHPGEFWENAKDLLKILLAVLPISLYLLMTLLKVTNNQENPNILQGTSLGWFLEIFFVYLASLMFGVHLLYSSKFSFKGDYLGIKLRNDMVQSLSTVGTVISAIAIVLFVIDFSRQLFVVIYFISYFIMVTLLFVLFLDIFEPISIYLVSKFVEHAKIYSTRFIKQEKPQKVVETKETLDFDFDIPSAKVSDLEDNVEPISQTTETVDEVKPELIEVSIEKVLQKEFKSFRRDFLNSGGKLLIKASLSILLILITMKVLNIVVNALGLKYKFNSSALQTIAFLSIFVILSIPLLITFYVFARRYFYIQLGAIATHGILVVIDWTGRQILNNINGSDKFDTLIYLNIVFTMQVFLVIGVLAFSLLLLRKFNWNSLTNISILFITGLVLVIAWLFTFSDTITIYLPFLKDPVISGINLTLPTYLNNRSPIPTFNALVVALQQRGEFWTTYYFLNIHISSLNDFFILPIVAGVPVNFVPLLGISSWPFRILQPLAPVFLFGIIVFLIGNDYITVQYKYESTVEKIIYSERQNVPTLFEINTNPDNYAIERNFGLEDENEIKAGFSVAEIEESIYQIGIGAHLVQFIGEAPISFSDLVYESSLTMEEILGFFNELSKISLAKAKPFKIYNREFGYSYEEAKMDSLHVMMVDGRSVFTHNFTDESKVEPALVSGLFSAITSFAKETVKSSARLRTIDHGDVVLLIEYSEHVFSAIFADKNSVDLRSKLIEFLNRFETKHASELEGWLGDTSPFREDWMLVEEIFETE